MPRYTPSLLGPRKWCEGHSARGQGRACVPAVMEGFQYCNHGGCRVCAYKLTSPWQRHCEGETTPSAWSLGVLFGNMWNFAAWSEYNCHHEVTAPPCLLPRMAPRSRASLSPRSRFYQAPARCRSRCKHIPLRRQSNSLLRGPRGPFPGKGGQTWLESDGTARMGGPWDAEGKQFKQIPTFSVPCLPCHDLCLQTIP